MYGSLAIAVSPVRCRQNRLQAFAERRRESIAPRCIDEADGREIAKVGSIVIAVGGELHSDKRIQRDDAEELCLLGLVHAWRRVHLVVAHLLVCENDVHCTSRASVLAVEEHVDAGNDDMTESVGLHCLAGRRKIAAAKQDIDVSRRADRFRIHSGHPKCDGVAPDDGIGDPCATERCGRSEESMTDTVDGLHDSLQGKWSELPGHRNECNGSTVR